MQAEQKQILKSFLLPLVFIVILWIIKLSEIYFKIDFSNWGVLPRHPEGLKGIITMPFIHANIKHLFSNSVPLLILGASLIYFYRVLALRVFLWVWFLDGLWLWLGGRENYHIGASGIVYGLSGFLFFSGLFRRDTRLIAISMLVVFLYGGLVWGMFPDFLGDNISWEAHLYGAAAGALCGWAYRNEGPQRKQYDWENEDENNEEMIYIEGEPPVENESPAPPSIQINYDYKPNTEPDEPEESKPITNVKD